MSGMIGEMLGIMRDVMLGGRHSRRTIAQSTSASLPTADRWIADIVRFIPGMRTVRIGKVRWLEYVPPTWDRVQWHGNVLRGHGHHGRIG